LAFYDSARALRRYRGNIAHADAVIIGSYVHEGIEIGSWVLHTARGVKAFYDIDTPVTLAAVRANRCAYLTADQIDRYDLYLSFTGGPILRQLTRRYGARAARALYCSVDPAIYRPQAVQRRWDIGYLGTYSVDRQPQLERLLLEPARRAPHLRFVVAGPQYPSSVRWPPNVEHIAHLPPADHPRFYSSLGWALNVTRADMVNAGHSPSVRLFEAAACAAPLISDPWAGLDRFLDPETEIVVARGPDDVLATLGWPEQRRHKIAAAARRRILRHHTSQHRAAECETHLLAALADRNWRARRNAIGRARRNGSHVLSLQNRRLT
jgi:spore maturation protein CgeB